MLPGRGKVAGAVSIHNKGERLGAPLSASAPTRHQDVSVYFASVIDVDSTAIALVKSVR